MHNKTQTKSNIASNATFKNTPKKINEQNINQNKKNKTKRKNGNKNKLISLKKKSSRKVLTFDFKLTNCKKRGQYKLQARRT